MSNTESDAAGSEARKKVAGRLPDPDAPLLEQMGGVRGLVFSSIPVVTFVPLNSLFGLDVAIWGALGVALAMFVYSFVRRENLQPAISGFVAVGIGVFIAWRTGDARGYFLYGIIVQAVYAVVMSVSALVRWPLVGVIWGFVQGHGQSWRKVRGARWWYALATWMWAGFFAFRFVVQGFLYYYDEVEWLGAARIAMGWPLAIVGFAVTVWAVKKAMDHEKAAGLAAPTSGDGELTDDSDSSGDSKDPAPETAGRE